MWAKDPSYTPVPGYQRTRAYRAASPEQVERERRRNAARRRALVKLSRAYPEAFKALYHGELTAVDLPVPRGAHRDGAGHG